MNKLKSGKRKDPITSGMLMEKKYKLNKLGFKSKQVKELHKKREKKLEPGQKAGSPQKMEGNPEWLQAFNAELATLGPLSKPQKLNMDG